MGQIISSNKGIYSNYEIIDGQKKLMMTPNETAEEVMEWILPQIGDGDTVLEPFRGDGAFYDKILSEKYYCEIDEGIDFFHYNKTVDWAISNPPFRVLQNGEPVNAFIPIINHTMKLCNKGFFYLVNHKLWSSLTVKRLRDWNENGWVVSGIKIIEIKKWYGRYYVIKFEKGGTSILNFD
jgi:hypothetical protein